MHFSDCTPTAHHNITRWWMRFTTH